MQNVDFIFPLVCFPIVSRVLKDLELQQLGHCQVLIHGRSELEPLTPYPMGDVVHGEPSCLGRHPAAVVTQINSANRPADMRCGSVR